MKPLFLFVLLFISLFLTAADIPVKIIAVHDGDTYAVENASGQLFKIRLYEVDAPELRQSGGVESKEAAADILSSADEVYIELVSVSYDRDVAIVEVIINGERKDLGEILTESGMAWFCKSGRKSYRQDKLRSSNAVAIENHIGLWSRDIPPVEPWTWRNNQNLIITDNGEKLVSLIKKMNPNKNIQLNVENEK